MVDRSSSSNARTLWWIVAAYAVGIWVSAYFIQFLLTALRDRGWLSGTIAVSFVAVAAFVGARVVRGRPTLAQWLVLVVAALVMGAAALHLEVVQERVHLVQYGLMGWLAWVAWRASRPSGPLWRAAVAATAIAAAVGLVDELVQLVLPNRYYDTRDVVLNAVSGGIVVAAAALFTWLDRSGGTAPGPDVE